LKLKTTYILIILGALALGLLIFNNYYAYFRFSVVPKLEYSKLIFALGLFGGALFYFLKKWRRLLAKLVIGAFAVCVILNLQLVVEFFQAVQKQNRLSEYVELNTCKDLETRFALDLKKGEIKYFQFGLVYDTGLEEELNEKYGIETFGMGCNFQDKFECYNKLVMHYVQEHKNR